MNAALDIRTTAEGIVFKIHVQPKASRTEVAGIHDDAIKIRLTAPPVDNAANTMCLKFLSKALHIPKFRLEIVAGRTGRNKHILIHWPADTPPEIAGREIMKQIVALLE